MDPRWKGKTRARMTEASDEEEESAAPRASAMDLDDEIIDLTSDAEDPSPQSTRSGYSPRGSSGSSSDPDIPPVRDEVKREGSKGKGVNGKRIERESAKRYGAKQESVRRYDVKREGAKRAAADVTADSSGDVEVASKPAEEDVDFSRPAKRGKGPARARGEEDVEMVGRKGFQLPHNRFSCPENPFVLADESAHKNRCKLCFCYVCDRPATDCSEWEDHCHASNAGARKSLWANMRGSAKLRLRDGKRPPVSHLYDRMPAAVLSGFVVPPRRRASVPSASGSSSSRAAPAPVKASPTPDPPNECNCEELCKPVHRVFIEQWSYQYVHPGEKRQQVVAYLKGLTEPQVLHVEKIAVLSTLKRAARKEVKCDADDLSESSQASRTERILQYEEERMPHVHKVSAGGETFDMMVAAKYLRSWGEQAPPWNSKWTPGVESAADGVRLGGVDNLGFELETDRHGRSLEERKAYFDHFITERPLPVSVWSAVKDSEVTMAKENHYLLRRLQEAHDNSWIEVEVQATFDPITNSGAFSLEVILLSQLLSRGTSMCDKSKADFEHIVKCLVLKKGAPPDTGSSSFSSSFSSSSSSSSSSSLPSTAPVATPAGPSAGEEATTEVASAGKVGRTFKASLEGWGGRASLDVTLSGLLDSLRNERHNRRSWRSFLETPAKLLMELENLQHRALIEQPACLTVQLYEHQLQDAQWMFDQEMLEGGSMQHLWAELPPHPLAPANGQRQGEFRTCWFSPVLNQFTLKNPFHSGMKGGILCDEMGLGKTAATLALHLVNPPKTPSEGVPLDENEWGPISGPQATDLVCPKSTTSSKEAPGSVVSKGTLVVCKVSIVGQWVEADASRNGGFPPLRRIRWWRVVLDESHTIAHTTKAARVVKQLIANRRWCMTGTPYISKFSDVNGQLGFIGLEGAFSDRDLGDQKPNMNSKAETLATLRRVLLRHSQGMTLGGSSILGLPTITHEVDELTLPPKERRAYVDFEKAVQKDYTGVRYRLLNERGSHTMEVLTLLSKFRQACSGGQLLIDQSEKSGESGKGGSAAASCIDAFCPMCSELVESPVRTWCGHVFCQACITSALTKAPDEERPCPKCKKTVTLQDLTPVGKGGGSSGFSSAADQSEGQQPQGGGSGASPPGVLMETKLKALVGKLSAIHAEDPTSKSLVFSQFNSSLEWLKRTLPKCGFEFRTLTGSMSRKQRTDALKAFANDPPTTVFLLSVRSGAVGINLTQANNVFFLEPLLNLALEKQAVGRVFRLGQSRPVTVTKLALKDSIETRILAMQKSEASTEPTPSSSAEANSSSISSGVAGNISTDDAKNLKIEEYNALFGLSEDQPKTAKSKTEKAVIY